MNFPYRSFHRISAKHGATVFTTWSHKPLNADIFLQFFPFGTIQSFLRIRRNIFHVDISKQNPCFYIVQFQRELRYVQIQSTNMIEMVRNAFTDTDATFEHRLQENSSMLLRCIRINDTTSVELTAVWPSCYKPTSGFVEAYRRRTGTKRHGRVTRVISAMETGPGTVRRRMVVVWESRLFGFKGSRL